VRARAYPSAQAQFRSPPEKCREGFGSAGTVLFGSFFESGTVGAEGGALPRSESVLCHRLDGGGAAERLLILDLGLWDACRFNGGIWRP
jgi:hypothetical protein